MAMVECLRDCCSLWARCVTARPANAFPLSRTPGPLSPVSRPGPGAAPEAALPAAPLEFRGAPPWPRPEPPAAGRGEAAGRGSGHGLPWPGPGPPGAPSPYPGPEDAGAALPGGHHGARRGCHRGAAPAPATRSSRTSDSRLDSGRPQLGALVLPTPESPRGTARPRPAPCPCGRAARPLPGAEVGAGHR